jgi:hypothetical protein
MLTNPETCSTRRTDESDPQNAQAQLREHPPRATTGAKEPEGYFLQRSGGIDNTLSIGDPQAASVREVLEASVREVLEASVREVLEARVRGVDLPLHPQPWRGDQG